MDTGGVYVVVVVKRTTLVILVVSAFPYTRTVDGMVVVVTAVLVEVSGVVVVTDKSVDVWVLVAQLVIVVMVYVGTESRLGLTPVLNVLQTS